MTKVTDPPKRPRNAPDVLQGPLQRRTNNQLRHDATKYMSNLMEVHTPLKKDALYGLAAVLSCVRPSAQRACRTSGERDYPFVGSLFSSLILFFFSAYPLSCPVDPARLRHSSVRSLHICLPSTPSLTCARFHVYQYKPNILSNRRVAFSITHVILYATGDVTSSNGPTQSKVLLPPPTTPHRSSLKSHSKSSTVPYSKGQIVSSASQKMSCRFPLM